MKLLSWALTTTTSVMAAPATATVRLATFTTAPMTMPAASRVCSKWLRHFIGATLGNTGYVRHRDDEFSLKNIPRQDLLMNIENCILMVNVALKALPEEDLVKDFPLEVFGRIVKTDFMLLHLTTHLNYHLGQINYHRRLLD